MVQHKDKKAVVLAGGGARGSYQIGVWKALREIGYDYSIVTGCSVGSINGSMMVMNEFDRAMELWEIIETEKILDYDISGAPNTPGGLLKVLTEMVGKAFKDKGISAAPLKKVLDQFVDGKAMLESEIDYGITVTQLNGYKGKEIFLKDIDYNKINDYIMASSAFYPIMQSYNIDDEEHIDGGYYNNIPISMAVDMGATEIVVVDLKSIGLVKKIKIPSDIKVTNITTSWDLGALLMFDPDRAKRNIELGYLDGLKAFGLLDGEKYTFNKGQLEIKQQLVQQNIKILLERMKINLFYNSINSSDLLIKSNILRTINKDISSDINISDMILFGAEFMGSSISVSPLYKYSFAEFDQQILSKLDSQDNEEQEENRILSEKELMEYLLGKYVTKGKKSLFFRIYEIMSKDTYSDMDINILNIAATVSTSEFLASLYGISSGIILPVR